MVKRCEISPDWMRDEDRSTVVGFRLRKPARDRIFLVTKRVHDKNMPRNDKKNPCCVHVLTKNARQQIQRRLESWIVEPSSQCAQRRAPNFYHHNWRSRIAQVLCEAEVLGVLRLSNVAAQSLPSVSHEHLSIGAMVEALI